MKHHNQQKNHDIQVGRGDNLADKYVVLSQISSGGMSEVYLVEEKATPDNRWAVKAANQNHPLAHKLSDEAKLLSELEHPYLPYVVDFFADDNNYYLVMEYIQGVSLLDYLDLYGQPFSVERIIRIGKQLCDVLEYLHQQQPNPIIYRDIKPGNILLMEDGTIKLIDFGTARKYDDQHLMDTVRVGTVAFAAPEQFEKKQTDERTDLFSLGALLYYLLSEGKYVYTVQKPIGKLCKGLPKSLRKCVDRLVRLEPSERIQTVQEAKSLLEHAEKELENQPQKRRKCIRLVSIVSISALFIGYVITNML